LDDYGESYALDKQSGHSCQISYLHQIVDFMQKRFPTF